MIIQILTATIIAIITFVVLNKWRNKKQSPKKTDHGFRGHVAPPPIPTPTPKPVATPTPKGPVLRKPQKQNKKDLR